MRDINAHFDKITELFMERARILQTVLVDVVRLDVPFRDVQAQILVKRLFPHLVIYVDVVDVRIVAGKNVVVFIEVIVFDDTIDCIFGLDAQIIDDLLVGGFDPGNPASVIYRGVELRPLIGGCHLY